MNLNDLAKQVHAANAKWWTDLNTGERIERNKGELLMLVITELAEAVEGIRKGLMDDKLPHRKMEEVEMADAKIRLLDFAGGFGIDLSAPACKIGTSPNGNKGEQILEICGGVYIYWLNGNPAYFADIIYAIDEYCQAHSLDLDGALQEKMAYNRTRLDHQPNERLKPGGKKF